MYACLLDQLGEITLRRNLQAQAEAFLKAITPDRDNRIVAVECLFPSTRLRAGGGVWHKTDREAGRVPPTSIATEAHWTKAGWHGSVSGHR